MQEPSKTSSAADLSKEDRATLRTGRAAQDWLDSEFGKFFMSALDAHIETERRKYEIPIEAALGVDGLAQVLRAEAAKGAIMGLRLARAIPGGMVEAAKQLRVAKGLKTAGEHDD